MSESIFFKITAILILHCIEWAFSCDRDFNVGESDFKVEHKETEDICYQNRPTLKNGKIKN